MDDTSIQGQLTALKAAVEENNRILKAMRRDALIGAIIKFAIWFVLIGGSLYLSTKFLEPYLGMLQSAQGASGGQDWQALLDQYREMMGQ